MFLLFLFLLLVLAVLFGEIIYSRLVTANTKKKTKKKQEKLSDVKKNGGQKKQKMGGWVANNKQAMGYFCSANSDRKYNLLDNTNIYISEYIYIYIYTMYRTGWLVMDAPWCWFKIFFPVDCRVDESNNEKKHNKIRRFFPPGLLRIPAGGHGKQG